MALYPEVQKKCQDEIDSIVGRNNNMVPTLDDIEK
jgi:hypothetical protein